MVGVAHEAFLSAWPPLARAAADNTAALRARRAAEQAAAEWDEAGAPASGCGNAGSSPPPWPTPARASRWRSRVGQRSPALPTRTPRHGHAGDRVLVTEQVSLSPAARRFLELSIRGPPPPGRSTTILAALLALAVLAAGVAVLQQQAAEQRQRLATARLLLTQAEATVVQPIRAPRCGSARPPTCNPSPRPGPAWPSWSVSTRYAGTLQGQNALVRSVAFAPDGRTLATAGATRR